MSGSKKQGTAKGLDSKHVNGTRKTKREATCSDAPAAEEQQTHTSEELKKGKHPQRMVGVKGDQKEIAKNPSVMGSGSIESSKTEVNAKTTTREQVQPEDKDTALGARPKSRARQPEKEEVKDKVKTTSRSKNVAKESGCVKVQVDSQETGVNIEDKKADDTKMRKPRNILNKTLEKLQIKMTEKSKASEVINKIEEVILKHLKENTTCFKEVEKPLHTGSYYENLKISKPDEFDIMFPIPLPRVDIEPFNDDGAFYSASLKRGNTPLRAFLSESNLLPASEILQKFRDEVIKSIRKFPGVDIDRKKRGCPAVTLTVAVDSGFISLDIVLCLVVKSSWPTFTDDGFKIESWLGTKVKKEYKYLPYYLVPKYEGKGTEESNGVLAKDAWRVSFSHVEKKIISNHGSEKTCCERDGTHCCRKDCLKLLKHLLGLLKNQDKTFDKFCSYHVKTTLLHACCSRPKDSQWKSADLSECFQQLLENFEAHLEQHELKNFFIPTQNLLSNCSQKSCKSLALKMKEQREKGFPIFTHDM